MLTNRLQVKMRLHFRFSISFFFWTDNLTEKTGFKILNCDCINSERNFRNLSKIKIENTVQDKIYFDFINRIALNFAKTKWN